MKNGFIELTTKLGKPIIIGVSNIASIEPFGTYSMIILNYPAENSNLGRVIDVKETFDEIKVMLGLTDPSKSKITIKRR